MIIDLSQLGTYLGGLLAPAIPPAPFSGALVTRSALGDQTVLAGNADAVIWSTEIYDDGGWFAGGSPTVFTVPTGITRVRTFMNIEFGAAFNTADKVFIKFLKNGSVNPSVGAIRYMVQSTFDLQWSCKSPVYDVVATDTLGVQVDANGITPASLAISGGVTGAAFGVEAVQ